MNNLLYQWKVWKFQRVCRERTWHFAEITVEEQTWSVNQSTRQLATIIVKSAD